MRPSFFVPFVALSLAVDSASGAEIVFDFTNMGTSLTTNVIVPPLYVSAAPSLPVPMVSVSPLGLGAKGGFSNDTLDGSERFEFAFSGHAALGVHYDVLTSGNLNGNNSLADALIEGFGANYASLGTVAVNGIGDHDVSALFNNAPLTYFRVTAQADWQRIGSLRYNVQLAPKVADFLGVATGTYLQLSVSNVTVEAFGPAGTTLLITALKPFGLAAVYTFDPHPNLLNGGEQLQFSFGAPGAPTAPAEDVSWFVSAALDLGGNGTSGNVRIDAWDETNNWLGAVLTATDFGTWNLRSFFPSAFAFSRFGVSSDDGLMIGSVSYVPDTALTTKFDTTTTSTARLLGAGIVAHAMNGGALATLATVTGSGLGVAGGIADGSIEGAESVVCFADGCAAGSIDVMIGSAVDGNGNSILGEGTIEAFDGVGNSQGVVPISGNGLKRLSSLFPGPLFSGFAVRAASGDRLSLTRVRIVPQAGLFAYPFYGEGCVGSGPLAPTARVTAFGSHGFDGLNVALANGPANQPAFIFLGAARADVPAGYDCRLFVSPLIGPIGPIPLDANGAFPVLPAAVPGLLVGVTATLQAFIADPASPAGYSTTNGVELNLKP